MHQISTINSVLISNLSEQFLILKGHMTSNGAVVYTTDDLGQDESGHVDQNSFLLVPSDIPSDKISLIPTAVRDIPRVTEWWLELCLQDKKFTEPSEDRFLQPFFRGPISSESNKLASIHALTWLRLPAYRCVFHRDGGS